MNVHVYCAYQEALDPPFWTEVGRDQFLKCACTLGAIEYFTFTLNSSHCEQKANLFDQFLHGCIGLLLQYIHVFVPKLLLW